MEQEPDLNGFRLFLQENERSENTIRSYLHAVIDYFAVHSKLTKQEVIAWKAELSKKYSASTVNLRLNAIRRYAEFKETLIPIRPMKVQRIFSAENVITDEQYHHLMYCLKSDEEWQWYYNILILAKTGTRISETVRLKKSDVLQGYAVLFTKGKVRTILFPLSLKEELKDYLSELENQEYLLQSTRCRGTVPISPRSVNHALKRFADRYQIPRDVMHPHSFRHHFGVKVMQKTSDISYVADLMGHENISTTRIYTQQSISQQQEGTGGAVTATAIKLYTDTEYNSLLEDVAKLMAVTSGTGIRNTSYVSSTSFAAEWYKIGRICTVNLQYNLSQLTPSSVEIITGLPKPLYEIACVGEGSNNTNVSDFVIKTNGAVRTHYDGAEGQFMHGTATYITAD